MPCKITARVLLIAIILTSLFLSLPSIPQQDISEYEKRLAKLAEQIKELQAKIKKGEKEETSILSRLDKIGLNKRLIRKEISLYNTRLEKANKELATIKRSISELKKKLEGEKKSIEKILVTMYKFGKFSFLQSIFQAKDMGTFISENKRLTLLAQYQRDIISGYVNTLTELNTNEEAQEAKKEEISTLNQNAKQKNQELAAQERKNKALIREIKRDRSTHIQTLEEYKERSEQLQIFIKNLLEKEVSLPFPLVPLYEKKGKLPWPVEGKLITRFGIQRHPRFKTITMNNGIEISPGKKGIIVKSVHPGKVVYSDYFKGYGNLIIIDHGMTYYSLYGHCSDFLAKKGEFVKAQHPIAFVGDFGSLEGVSLYFEIRFKTKPLDPLQWLRRR
ncbi:MAG: peptidoglycan DD-metalloendopeptidase family protein [Candidatus Aminicenantes bacterium]|nr:MAG: peptidoglycan DD-metalloendopeptidase family protein [Candidatus Aminicenantes bacterium]